jgi:hypothetical protein
MTTFRLLRHLSGPSGAKARAKTKAVTAGKKAREEELAKERRRAPGSQGTVSWFWAKGEADGAWSVRIKPALAGTFNCRRPRSGSSRHAGQLNWQHTQDYFHDCHPEHSTPKNRFGGTLLQQYPKPYNINRLKLA